MVDVLGIDLGTCSTGVVMALHSGLPTDTTVHFHGPNNGQVVPGIWQSFFKLTSEDPDQFVKSNARKYQGDAFFSPMVRDAATARQEKFIRLFKMASLTQDLRFAAYLYFKSKLASKATSDTDVLVRIYGVVANPTLPFAELEVSPWLLLAIFLGLMLARFTAADVAAVMLTIPDSFSSEARAMYEEAFELAREAVMGLEKTKWEKAPGLYITTEGVAGVYSFAALPLPPELEEGTAHIVRVDYGGKTGQAVVMSIDIEQDPETRVNKLKGLSIIETVGDDDRAAGMIDGVVMPVAQASLEARRRSGAAEGGEMDRLQAGIEARAWVDDQLYYGGDTYIFASVASNYFKGRSPEDVMDMRLSFPGLTYRALYRILKAHLDSKERLLRLLVPDNREGVKAVLWTGNAQRGDFMRGVLTFMTTKVFPNAKPLFETSQQQLVANGALIEWFAEVHGKCIGHECAGQMTGRIMKVGRVEDVMHDRLEIFRDITSTGGKRAPLGLEAKLLIGGKKTRKVKRGDSGSVEVEIKEDMLLTIQQVRTNSHVTACRTLIPQEGRMNGDTLSAVYLGQGAVFVYLWKDCEGEGCKREPVCFRKGEGFFCGVHKNTSTLEIPRCSTEGCRLAARLRQGGSGDAYCVKCFQRLDDEKLGDRPVVGLRFFNFNCATFHLESTHHAAKADAVSRWIKNLKSTVADECKRLGRPLNGPPLEELRQEALTFERETGEGEASFAQLWRAQKRHVPKVIRAIERLTSVEEGGHGDIWGEESVTKRPSEMFSGVFESTLQDGKRHRGGGQSLGAQGGGGGPEL